MMKESKNKINLYEQGQIELLFLKSDHEFPLHSHESWCIGIVTEGTVLFSINGKEKLLKRGMVYIIPSNIGVSIKPQHMYKYVSVCIKGDLKEVLNGMDFCKYYMELEDVDEFLIPCYNFMWSGDENKFVDEICTLLQSVADSSENQSEEEIINEISPNIKIVVDHLKKHIYDKFDLDEIAQIASTSKYHLVRQFKKEMGVTPHQYYIQNKLRVAKKDILEDQNEIEIATELNFADQSHLCRNFKQQMGITIQEYKRNFRKK